jgi:hypothetical protein
VLHTATNDKAELIFTAVNCMVLRAACAYLLYENCQYLLIDEAELMIV